MVRSGILGFSYGFAVT